jgi:hypothetical protein
MLTQSRKVAEDNNLLKLNTILQLRRLRVLRGETSCRYNHEGHEEHKE